MMKKREDFKKKKTHITVFLNLHPHCGTFAFPSGDGLRVCSNAVVGRGRRNERKKGVLRREQHELQQ
jgi:hypothetical protein